MNPTPTPDAARSDTPDRPTTDAAPDGRIELLPCPFCGSAGEIISSMGLWEPPDGYSPDGSRVRCSGNCSVCTDACYGDGKESRAAAIWNTRAALAKGAGAAVQEGWKLVPVEPTDDMLSAADEAMVDTLDGDNWLRHAQNAWDATVAAAPDLPTALAAALTPAREGVDLPSAEALAEAMWDAEALSVPWAKITLSSTSHDQATVRNFRQSAEKVRARLDPQADKVDALRVAAWQPIATCPDDESAIWLGWDGTNLSKPKVMDDLALDTKGWAKSYPNSAPTHWQPRQAPPAPPALDTPRDGGA